MARLIACPDCGARFDVASMRIGTRFRCGACGKILIVPPPKAPSTQVPAAPKRTAVRRRPGARGAPARRPAAGVRKQAPAAKKLPAAPARAKQAPAKKAVAQPPRAKAAPAQPPAKPRAQPKPKTAPSKPSGVVDAPTPASNEITDEPARALAQVIQRKDPLLGETVKGIFKVEKKLGEGGYGVVYRARDMTLQRPVALKVMLRRLTESAEFVGKFRREARTAAALTHPNVVSIHDVGFDRDHGVHYLAMEYVEGPTLTEVLEERGPLAAQEAIDFVLQATNGLAAAHAKQIIHRDIKPGNMMITNRGVVKITDFGLAKVYDPSEATSTVIGSPHYMPPEQFEGKARDGRSDIYSLGITFYMMLTGQRPFDGNNPADILRNIMTKEPEAVEDLATGLPKGLSAIVKRMIARSLEERYSDVGDVARDLRRLYMRETGGERIFCPGCGTPNALGVKRCSECTASLMEPCPKCGTEDFVGVKFCGSCGCSISQEKEFSEILTEGRELRTGGRPDRALEKFRKLVDLRPDDEEVRVALEFVEKEARALEKHRGAVQNAMESDDFDRAAELLEQARDRFAGDPELRGAEDELADRLRRRRIDTCLEAARRGLDGKRFEDALASVEEAAAAGAEAEEADPIRDQARAAIDQLTEVAARARDLEAAGSVSRAIDEWEKAAEISPEWTPAVEALAAHRERLARVEEARTRATEAFERGDLTAARAATLEIVEEIADDPEANGLLEKIGQVEGEVRRRLVGAMKTLSQGDPKAAFAELEDLLDSYPSYPDLSQIRDHVEGLLQAADFFRHVAAHSKELGRLEPAVAFAEVAAWLDASDRRARDAAAQTERELEARRQILDQAHARLDEQDFAAAIELIRPLAESLPDDTEVQTVCSTARRGLEEARREENQRRVTALNTALKESREALREGDLDAARTAVATAEQLAPDQAEVKALRREIEDTTERERKVEETAFFRLEDLRKMARDQKK